MTHTPQIFKIGSGPMPMQHRARRSKGFHFPANNPTRGARKIKNFNRFSSNPTRYIQIPLDNNELTVLQFLDNQPRIIDVQTNHPNRKTNQFW